jgi:hypothetical protein
MAEELKQEKESVTWKEMLEKIRKGKVGMIGTPKQHPLTEKELEEFQESYRKALAKKVKNIYKKAGETKK